MKKFASGLELWKQTIFETATNDIYNDGACESVSLSRGNIEHYAR